MTPSSLCSTPTLPPLLPFRSSLLCYLSSFMYFLPFPFPLPQFKFLTFPFSSLSFLHFIIYLPSFHSLPPLPSLSSLCYLSSFLYLLFFLPFPLYLNYLPFRVFPNLSSPLLFFLDLCLSFLRSYSCSFLHIYFLLPIPSFIIFHHLPSLHLYLYSRFFLSFPFSSMSLPFSILSSFLLSQPSSFTFLFLYLPYFPSPSHSPLP